jgi:hypothetical protein
MSEPETYPQLHFREPFDKEVAWEISNKGWYNGIVVELQNGARYSVFFYDPVRLTQDLQTEAELGRPYVAEPGMIVVPELSEVSMRLAVQRLHREGWFNHLRPVGPAA